MSLMSLCLQEHTMLVHTNMELGVPPNGALFDSFACTLI